MLTLVSGPNGSGKSAYAERMMQRLGSPLFYIATMIPQGSEGVKRVLHHRAQRAGLGFTTLELPYRISAADVLPNGAVLVEDASNLLSNAMFSFGATARDVEADLFGLAKRCRALVVVTIAGLDESAYEGETRAFVHALNALNAALFAAADAAITMRCGSPVLQKGEDPCA